jgi:Fic family protein
MINLGMAVEFIPPSIKVDSEIIQLLEAISRKQGELSTHSHSLRDQFQIEAIAAIDAVHFSTKIEGNHLTRDQVTQALLVKKPKSPTHDLQEVLNYSRTRKLAKEWVLKDKPFNEEWILSHHSELLHGIVKGKLKGHYRTAQCVIQDSKTGSVVYMAADAKDLPRFMKGLVSWLRQQRGLGVSPLLLAAQFHFEFVTIHPFMDGNGRLARLLTNGILFSEGYDVERFAALEKQHEQNRSLYYQSLRKLQAYNFYDIPPAQNINSWVLYWLRCLLNTYGEALERVSGFSSSENSSSTPGFDRLKKAEILFRQHRQLRASEYADLLGIARTQAVADLNNLMVKGILEKVGGGRSTVYRLKPKKVRESRLPN